MSSSFNTYDLIQITVSAAVESFLLPAVTAQMLRSLKGLVLFVGAILSPDKGVAGHSLRSNIGLMHNELLIV